MSERITLHEAAERVGVSTRTLRRYIADGRLTAYRIGPRIIRVDPADLEQIQRPMGPARWSDGVVR